MKRLDTRSAKVSWPILGLLVVTLGLIVYAYFHGDEDETPPAPATASRSAAEASGGSAASATNRAQGSASENVANAERPPVDLFPSQNWQPPPPPPDTTPRPPPPPPEPPPLPFTVRSLWLDQTGAFYVVLAGTGREFPLCANCQKKGFLRRGDVILGAYRIDGISRQDVRFTYLPLKRRQTLALGELK